MFGVLLGHGNGNEGGPLCPQSPLNPIFRGEGPSMNGTGDTLQQPLHKWSKSFMRSLTVLPKDVIGVFCFRVLKGESRVFGNV